MAVGIIAEELHSFWLNFNFQYVMYEFSKREFDLKRIKWGIIILGWSFHSKSCLV